MGSKRSPVLSFPSAWDEIFKEIRVTPLRNESNALGPNE